MKSIAAYFFVFLIAILSGCGSTKKRPETTSAHRAAYGMNNSGSKTKMSRKKMDWCKPQPYSGQNSPNSRRKG